MFKTIRSRILGLVSGVIIFTSVFIFVLVNKQTTQTHFNSYNSYAENVVSFLTLSVSNQYNSIEFYKKSVLELRKDELKQKVEVVMPILLKYYQLFKKGEISEYKAKRQAYLDISKIRYDNGVGYFWINNDNKPYPTMIMHPTIPKLNGTILDNPEFNCALGKNVGLFKAFVDVCNDYGEGYVDYLWPKPAIEGLTIKQPKISYVKAFKPWNWILGTGVYIDDIDRDVKLRVNAVVNELNEGIKQLKTGREGNIIVIDGEGNIIAHNSLVGQNISNITNKLTGNNLLADLKATLKQEHKFFDYCGVDEKNKQEVDNIRRAYVSFFEPLNWYIVSTYCHDQISKPAYNLNRKLLLIIGTLLFFALLVSLIFINSLTRPIFELSKRIMEIEKKGIKGEIPPIKGSYELVKFSNLLNTMIASLKNTQIELLKSKQLAEESNSLKSAFLANMSHEIRTPMNGVVGFTQLISDPNIKDEDRIRYSEIISKSSMQLLRVVNDIIDISKIETGQIILDVCDIDLNDFFEELYEIYLPIANEKNLSLIKDIISPELKCINSDYTKLRQIMDNLLNNAFKFTSKGSIIFGYEQLETGVVFFVKDTGIGLNEEDRAIIFNRFTQAKMQVENNTKGGTGLGLAISKAFVDFMGGEFWVESEVNMGSQFYFTIPKQKC